MFVSEEPIRALHQHGEDSIGFLVERVLEVSVCPGVESFESLRHPRLGTTPCAEERNVGERHARLSQRSITFASRN